MIESPVQPPTVWGLTPTELHARFWASRGVQVVPAGEATPLVPHAELFLLTDPRALAIFRVAGLLDTMDWLDPALFIIRLRPRGERVYREEVAAGPDGRFKRFRRVYAGSDHRVARAALTTDADLAHLWQQQSDARSAWRAMFEAVPRHARYAESVSARLYDASEPDEVARFVRDLATVWKRPDATIARVRAAGRGVWADREAGVALDAGVVGPLWIGAGRELERGATAVGPAVVWDRPGLRPVHDDVQWLDLEALTPPRILRFVPPPPLSQIVKRAFDLAFALGVVAMTWPLWLAVALAILIEDGRPITFGHRRETIGGRPFNCLKFRSMRKDAEKMKAKLAAMNQADGPQFFIENDPRLTAVGRFIRKYQIDELPQFLNVLRGEMSVVGPRPSPYAENQYCPGWREARLSVRPGITGLWQVKRTRSAGSDFQEWIRYDIEYVERQSFWFDISIIVRTALAILRRFTNP
jgi:lipopolysaccharide/colanic/teichoic acid biosynthesis glycosyltransferase